MAIDPSRTPPNGGEALRRFAVPAIAAAAVLARISFLGSPLGKDEAGLLLIASQWEPGSSLYGDYFVDRPPLLLALFSLAHLFGGETALRLLGCAAAAVAVLLAASIGRVVAGPRASPWTALATAGLVSTPLFGADEVVGELLAVPFVLAGILALLQTRTAIGRRRTLLLVASGAAGAAAFLIKQSFVDVFVAAAVLLVADGVASRTRSFRHTAMRTLLPFVGGAAVVVAGCLAGAASRGTSVTALWDAVVVFRMEAALVIADSATSATTDRMGRFPLALVVSGVALLVVAFAARCVSARVDRVAWCAFGLLVWESFAVLAGGGFWMHYLLGLVPGLCVALAVVLAPAEPRRADTGPRHAVGLAGRVGAAWAMTSAAVLVVGSLATGQVGAPSTAGAAAWLERNSQVGDTAFIAYGQPNILVESGTTSPYEELWSLPMRVRDPHLRQLESVMRSGSAPVWILARRHWDTWGIDATRVKRIVDREYRQVGKVCGWVVYLREGVERTHSDKTSCQAWALRA